MENIEELGQRIIDYTKVYQGTDKYDAIMLAIEFGYQLALKENKYENNR